MIDVLTIQEVRGELSGLLIGFELITHPGGDKILVFADQAGMPGFRIGSKFIPGIGEKLMIGKKIVLKADG